MFCVVLLWGKRRPNCFVYLTLVHYNWAFSLLLIPTTGQMTANYLREEEHRIHDNSDNHYKLAFHLGIPPFDITSLTCSPVNRKPTWRDLKNCRPGQCPLWLIEGWSQGVKRFEFLRHLPDIKAPNVQERRTITVILPLRWLFHLSKAAASPDSWGWTDLGCERLITKGEHDKTCYRGPGIVLGRHWLLFLVSVAAVLALKYLLEDEAGFLCDFSRVSFQFLSQFLGEYDLIDDLYGRQNHSTGVVNFEIIVVFLGNKLMFI